MYRADRSLIVFNKDLLLISFAAGFIQTSERIDISFLIRCQGLTCLYVLYSLDQCQFRVL
jgi:hypothetical protein